MNILVLSNREPFSYGGAEELALNLVRNLSAAGHQAEAMRLPMSWDPYERLVDEIVIARSLELVNADLVIALKFPMYLVPHKNKVIWLLHQLRQAYDLFDAGDPLIPRTQRGDEVRRMIKAADELAFSSARSLFALPNSAKRMKKYHDIDADVLIPPLNDPEIFLGGESQSYIFAGGRIAPGKRQDLLIEALKYAPNVRLVVAGAPGSQDERERLANIARHHGLSDRITLDVRFLSRQEIAAFVNNAIASAYIPIDEDNVGYVTLEAFQAAKPIITTRDAGGVLDIVRDDETGLVCDPTPQALGAAMSQLHEDRGKAIVLGQNGRDTLADMNLSWPKTIARLLS